MPNDRPSDVPEWAWEKALAVWTTSGFVSDRLNQVQHVARGLVAAEARGRAAERERCAGIARAATKVGNEAISMTIENAIRAGE